MYIYIYIWYFVIYEYIGDKCHCAQTECENAGFTWAFRTEADGGNHCTCEGCSAGYGDENVYSQGECEALSCFWDGLSCVCVKYRSL